MHNLDPDRLLTLDEVVAMVSLSRSEIYRRMRECPPRFPLPVKHGPGRVAWRYRDIRGWISDLNEFGEWIPEDHDDLPDHPDETF